jgi:hypothetical protein
MLVPANFTPLPNTNSANPLKSGKMDDDMEITRIKELLWSWRLSMGRLIFTPGKSAQK